MRDYALGWILLAVFVAVLAIAIFWLCQPVHVEGEIIGKEESQKAFLSNSPPMLVVNLTDEDPVLVAAGRAEFHQYEVGDWFNETRVRGEVGSGISYADMAESFILILPLFIVFNLFATVIRGRYS